MSIKRRLKFFPESYIFSIDSNIFSFFHLVPKTGPFLFHQKRCGNREMGDGERKRIRRNVEKCKIRDQKPTREIYIDWSVNLTGGK
jgi:hypothetical protein